MELENLKFRAKITPNGNWIYGYPVKLEDGWGFVEIGNYSWECQKVNDPSTITMCTGETDKNDNDIYFNDLVHAVVVDYTRGSINNEKKIEIIGEIIYREGVCFKVLDVSEDNGIYGENGIFPFRNLKNIEIIKEYNCNCFKSEKEILMSEIDILRKEKGSLEEEIDNIKHRNNRFSFMNIFKTSKKQL